MTHIILQEKIRVKKHYDIIVAGGGLAGTAAALSAARAGKSVLLLEKSLMLGGLATLGVINLFVPMCNGRGRQIIKGMAEEFLRLSIRDGYDTIPEEWRNGEPGPGAKTRYVTRFDPNIFAMALMETVIDEGVNLLFDTIAARPVMDGNHCRGLVVENKSGREFYGASMVIDTTGDADILHRAGVPVVQGNNFFSYSALYVSLETCRKAVETGDIRCAFAYRMGGQADLHGRKQPEDVGLYKGTSAEEVTDYTIRNQRMLMKEICQEPRSSRAIAMLPGMPQFRTVRHINGDYTLRVSDKYRHFEDSISAICDFENCDILYEVPYRCLCKKGYDNLITAGRSASAEGYAWDVLRVIPPAIVTGQAAGLAAVQAIDTRKAIWDIDIRILQDTLEKANVMVHFDDSLVPDKECPTAGEFFDIGHI
jgi:hypothetical protein